MVLLIRQSLNLAFLSKRYLSWIQKSRVRGFISVRHRCHSIVLWLSQFLTPSLPYFNLCTQLHDISSFLHGLQGFLLSLAFQQFDNNVCRCSFFIFILTGSVAAYLSFWQTLSHYNLQIFLLTYFLPLHICQIVRYAPCNMLCFSFLLAALFQVGRLLLHTMCEVTDSVSTMSSLLINAQKKIFM